MIEAAVTGIGMITPLGFGRKNTWDALLASRSAVKPDLEFPGILTARLEKFDVPAQARVLAMGYLAAAEAVKDSGLDFSRVDKSRFGCSASVSKPVLAGLFESGMNFDVFDPSSLSGQLSRVFELGGPRRNIAAACATGAHSIMIAAQWIREGLCDVVLAGASEASLDPLYVAGFDKMGVLASRMVCPFSKYREGFAIGEGAGMVLLERADHAMMRGARIYARLKGWAMGNDTLAAVGCDPEGNSIASTMRRALVSAGAPRIDYINAHGTATKLNDLAETRAIKNVFGEAAGKVAVSSTKAATGHLLGASGAVEACIAFMALAAQAVPPTLNLTAPDEQCDLDYVPNVPRWTTVETAMSLSFGFGGQIGVIVAGK